jgi:hypothetical protein
MGSSMKRKFIPTEAKLWLAEATDFMRASSTLKSRITAILSGMPQFKDADELMKRLQQAARKWHI